MTTSIGSSFDPERKCAATGKPAAAAGLWELDDEVMFSTADPKSGR